MPALSPKQHVGLDMHNLDAQLYFLSPCENSEKFLCLEITQEKHCCDFIYDQITNLLKNVILPHPPPLPSPILVDNSGPGAAAHLKK